MYFHFKKKFKETIVNFAEFGKWSRVKELRYDVRKKFKCS